MEKAFHLGNYEEALKFLNSNKEYQKVQNRLLYHLEKGTILFEQKTIPFRPSLFKRPKIF